MMAPICKLASSVQGVGYFEKEALDAKDGGSPSIGGDLDSPLPDLDR